MCFFLAHAAYIVLAVQCAAMCLLAHAACWPMLLAGLCACRPMLFSAGHAMCPCCLLLAVLCAANVFVGPCCLVPVALRVGFFNTL